jgi:hypothetical protein
MGTPILRITNGVTTVNFLSEVSGFFLREYTPSVGEYKGGGVFQDSPISNYRRLVFRKRDNIAEAITVAVRSLSQPEFAQKTKELRELLQGAGDYWIARSLDNDTPARPVWIEAKAGEETDIRYAILYDGKIVEDPNYYTQPFLQPGGAVAAESMTVTFERGDWMSHSPIAEGYAIPTTAYMSRSLCLYFNEALGAGTDVNFGTDIGIDNLLRAYSGGMTIEGWIQPWDDGESDDGYVVTKGTWTVRLDEYGDLGFYYSMSGGAAQDLRVTFSCGDLLHDGAWHHWALYFNNASQDYTDVRLWIDGIEKTEYSYDCQNGDGAVYADDQTYDLIFGNTSGGNRTFSGLISWHKIWRYQRYEQNFTPPKEFIPGDGEMWSAGFGINSGGGSTISTFGTNAADVGTITNARWSADTMYGLADPDYARWGSTVEVDGASEPFNPVYDTALKSTVLTNAPHPYNITDFYSGTSGTNLIETIRETPQTVVPIGTATDLYFGIAPWGSGNRYFYTLVIEIDEPVDTGFTLFQYYTGVAWGNLAVEYDTSNGFTRAGTHIIQISDVPNGTDRSYASPGSLPSRRYVRAVFDGSNATALVVSNVYTPTQNWFDIQGSSLGGDLTTKLRLGLRHYMPNDNRGVSNTVHQALYSRKVILAARSLARGKEFRSWLPFCFDRESGSTPASDAGDPDIDVGWNPCGIWTEKASSNLASSPSYGGVVPTTFYEDLANSSPHGGAYLFNVADATDEDRPGFIMNVRFPRHASRVYKGRHRLFLAFGVYGDNIQGDWKFQFRGYSSTGTLESGAPCTGIVTASSSPVPVTPWVPVRNLYGTAAENYGKEEAYLQLQDFGEIIIPDNDYTLSLWYDDDYETALEVDFYVMLFGIYLMPTDELYLEADPGDGYNGAFRSGAIIPDSTEGCSAYDTMNIGSYFHTDQAETVNNQIATKFSGSVRSNNEFALSPENDWRIHVLSLDDEPWSDVSLAGEHGWLPLQTYSPQLRGVDRYYAMRND